MPRAGLEAARPLRPKDERPDEIGSGHEPPWMGHHSPAFTLEVYGHLLDGNDLGPPLDLRALDAAVAEGLLDINPGRLRDRSIANTITPLRLAVTIKPGECVGVQRRAAPVRAGLSVALQLERARLAERRCGLLALATADAVHHNELRAAPVDARELRAHEGQRGHCCQGFGERAREDSNL
jgi:hypothetical protein